MICCFQKKALSSPTIYSLSTTSILLPMKEKIIRDTYDSPCGQLTLCSYKDKLCICDWSNAKNTAAHLRRVERALKTETEDGTSEVINLAKKQLREYFTRQRRSFSVPYKLIGTEFQKMVWSSLANIHYGRTISYGEQARRLGMPKSARAVANANGANALSILLPCHRVVGSDKSLTGYAGGLEIKQYLLDLEQGRQRIRNPQSLIPHS